ncbi:MAG: hypothetical protein ACRDJ5_08030 [Actinomycetota bacterium]
MVLAAQRAYADARRWIRSARPRRINRRAFARRGFSRGLMTGIVVLGLIALVSPSSFGEEYANTFALGWPLWVLLALMGACIAFGVSRLQQIRWVLARVSEPYRRALDDHPSWEGATGALDACPPAYRARFAMAYVYRPLALIVLGAFFAFCTAYFIVDALLASFGVGWLQPIMAVAFALLSLVTFGVTATGLSTWRLATSVHKFVSTGYP